MTHKLGVDVPVFMCVCVSMCGKVQLMSLCMRVCVIRAHAHTHTHGVCIDVCMCVSSRGPPLPLGAIGSGV